MEYETIMVSIEEDGEISATGITHDEKAYSIRIDLDDVDIGDDDAIISHITEYHGCDDVDIDRY